MGDEVRRSQSTCLVALGERTAILLHELRSPLMVVTLAIERIEACSADVSAGASIATSQWSKVAREGLDRALRLLSSISSYAAPPTLTRRKVDVARLCTAVAEGMGRETERLDLWCKETHVIGNPDELREVVINLLANAFEATDDERVSCVVSREGPDAVIRISNGGPAIPPPALARVFEPFFTTKVRGVGLGLSVVRRLVEAHDGTVDLRSSSERGTCATVRLPLAGQ